VEDGKAPEGQVGLYQTLVSEQWWQKNIIPLYAITKLEARDISGIDKEFDIASKSILSLTFNARGSSKESALNNVRAAAQFFRSGGAYIQIRNMLISIEGDVINSRLEIQREINNTKIEIGYQQKRIKFLKELQKDYPQNFSASQQMVDIIGQSDDKNLSINARIIGVNIDINILNEKLSRLEGRLAYVSAAKVFIDEALPQLRGTYDGLVLAKKLLAIEEKQRSKISNSDLNQEKRLDEIKSEVLKTQARFSKDLEASIIATANKIGVIKAMTAGLACGFFLMLIFLLGQREWFRVERRFAK
jgi:hypothetical protein